MQLYFIHSKGKAGAAETVYANAHLEFYFYIGILGTYSKKICYILV